MAWIDNPNAPLPTSLYLPTKPCDNREPFQHVSQKREG